MTRMMPKAHNTGVWSCRSADMTNITNMAIMVSIRFLPKKLNFDFMSLLYPTHLHFRLFSQKELLVCKTETP